MPKATCSVDGCERASVARGWCDAHYRQWRRSGEYPAVPIEVFASPVERFWSKVDKAGDCWVWMAGRYKNGYGQFSIDTKPLYAHRYSWELAHGTPVPEGAWVRHACDNPPCVNPAHLSLGTPLDNSADMRTRGRGSSLLTADQVRAIRSDPRAAHKVAAEVGICEATVWRIRRRQSWAWLD